ncbi:glycine-rich cell wall structural protein-like [Cimex lectularius]|uniref:CPR type cuticle protein n=1 Tax=Cimex lectularius TaxID=79782 RepID=A0A8I6R7S1_CIMLE|nr:glycine-rich cell wall structural protein-like [Cimex lectularius]
MGKIIFVTLCCIAVVYGHGESETHVSREHQGEYKFGVDHHFHGHWKGSSHPHGFAGLGDGHGDYKGADVKFVHFLPQSLHGGHGGQGGEGGQGGSGGGEGKEGGEGGKHLGHGTSYTNFNMKSVVEKHHGKW